LNFVSSFDIQPFARVAKPIIPVSPEFHRSAELTSKPRAIHIQSAGGLFFKKGILSYTRLCLLIYNFFNLKNQIE